jgi:hypothetical protein
LAELAKPAQLALFAANLLPNLPQRATGLIVWDQPDNAPSNTLLPFFGERLAWNPQD